MSCVYKKSIPLYIDGRLSQNKSNRIKFHLNTCRICSQEVVELERLSVLLGNLRTLKVSQAYEAKFEEKLNERLSLKKPPLISYNAQEIYDHTIDIIREILSPRLIPVKVGIIALISIVFLTTLSSLRQMYLPSFIALRGDVRVFKPRANKWLLAKSGMKLKQGDVVKIEKDGMLDLRFKDYFKIRAKQNTEFIIARFNTSWGKVNSEFGLINGTMLVGTERKLKDSTLKIKTPSALLVDKGTGFMVHINPEDNITWLGVLDGRVMVTNYFGYKEKEIALFVMPNQKMLIKPNEIPEGPVPLIASEYRMLEEINNIGKLSFYISFSKGPKRVRELFGPLRCYVYGDEPRELKKLVMRAKNLMDKAIKKKEQDIFLQGIETLKEAIERYPSPGHNPQFLIFIGSCYEFLGLHKEAVQYFERLIDKYPNSELSSIACCAIGIIYEEKLNNPKEAIKFYQKVLSEYQKSLEVSEAKEALKRLSE
ncbi:MAG: tetratricopeptide repeat protein [Candidatus Omnitrophica bacterium]|nr:tetratricopeptide repeat protein [Candidatus Omnitrophota bacterium]